MLPVAIGTKVDFDRNLDHVNQAPLLVVLDLRLPWFDQTDLLQDAMLAGFWCLDRLREEPNTARVPVVVHSAFIEDAAVADRLGAYSGITVVDKVHASRLETVVDNLAPATEGSVRRLRSLRDWTRSGERTLVRVGAVAGAITAGAALVALAVKVFS